jgi:glycosyltransferase involved in cell wall biosynthesis
MSDFLDASPSASARPLRILFHLDDFGRGGTETALIAWLGALDRRWFAPSLAVTFPTSDLDHWRAHGLPADVPVHILASSRWMYDLHQAQRERELGFGEKLVFKVLTHLAIRPIVARRFLTLARSADAVCDFDLTFRRIAGRGAVPWLGISHYSFSVRWAQKSAAYLSRRIGQLERYTALGVLAPAMRREAEQYFAGRSTTIVDLPNVFALEDIRRRADAEVALPPMPFIVCSARLDDGQKDHRTLLRAYALVRARGAAVGDLVLLGDGPARATLEALAAELGIARFVHFLGFCSNPFPYVRAADMLILSSRYEGLPMVIAEAMALGTPVIATDCPTGPRDLLGDGAGLLVTPGDVDGMADAIQQFIVDPALREASVRNATAKVETLAPSSANRRMLSVIEGMMRRAGPSVAAAVDTGRPRQRGSGEAVSEP